MAIMPDTGDLHVDGLLTNISIGYINTELYISDNIFPIVLVNKQSDIVPKYDQSYWFRNDAVIRAPKTASMRGGFEVDTSDTYFCPRYSFGFEIADEQRDNTDEPFNMDRDGTRFTVDKLSMAREVNFATDFFTTGVWGTDKTGGTDFTAWDDYANSSPLVDLSNWIADVEGLIARTPSDFVIGREVWTDLKWHPDLVDSIKYTQIGQVGLDMFAQLAELDRVHVGRTIYTTDVEGTAEGSVTYSRVWGKHGLLLYVPDSPSLFNPAAGYTFVWARVSGAIQYMVRHRNDEREVDIIEANSYFDHKATATNAGLFASGLVS